jgi:phosphomannomutase
VIVRPSGTEPKLKTYLQVVIDEIPPGDDGWRRANAEAEQQLAALGRELQAALGL